MNDCEFLGFAKRREERECEAMSAALNACGYDHFCPSPAGVDQYDLDISRPFPSRLEINAEIVEIEAVPRIDGKRLCHHPVDAWASLTKADLGGLD